MWVLINTRGKISISSSQYSHESWRCNWINCITLLHYQINISSSKSYFNESSWKFKSILNINIMTWLEYLISKFWLNLNTWFQNSDSNQVLTSQELDSISMTQLNAISLVKSSQIFTVLNSSEYFVYQEYWIMISFNQSIQFSIIHAKAKTIIFLFNE